MQRCFEEGWGSQKLQIKAEGVLRGRAVEKRGSLQFRVEQQQQEKEEAGFQMLFRGEHKLLQSRCVTGNQ